MALRSRLTAKVGKVYSKVARRLEGSALTVTLLKPSDDYDEFDELITLTGNWFFEYSNFRKNFLLNIAEDSEILTQAVAEATHIRIDGETEFAGAYSIIEGDTTPPRMTDVTWKIYCDKLRRSSRYASL